MGVGPAPLPFSSPVSIDIEGLQWQADPNFFISDITQTSGGTNILTVNSVNTDGSGSNPNISNIGITIPTGFVASTLGTAFSYDITTECFLTGTHILTDQGEIPVEQLTIGNKVKTADGKLEIVKWVGKQIVEPSRVNHTLRCLPILIKAGALGSNLPHRDLYVSPDHAMFFEGVLINAGALVNGSSIVKTEPQEPFNYYHVELENHAFLLAEGTAAESYLPQNQDRFSFENGSEYEELYPHGSNLMLWPMDYPRISSWNKVPRYMRQKLNLIAEELELVLTAA